MSAGRWMAWGGVAVLAGAALALRAPEAYGQRERTVSAEDRQRVEAAIPPSAPAKPVRPRKLLIYDANVGYPGHASIPVANLAFTLMGQKTGAFETVVSRDPAVFSADSLKQFDAVFLNNTVGNLFEDPALRQNLVEFVYAGGGLMGVHGTSVGFTRWPGAHEDWPEFGRMLGGRGARHLSAEEPVMIRLEEPDHPVTVPLGGKDFQLADEFFRFDPEPYSRHRVRVLLSMDNERTAKLQGRERMQQFRPDDDYALAWVRNYGRGRVFYTTIGHQSRVFWDPKMLSFFLAAAQFALGDLPAPTVPSARLTPALRAQEKLGWRLGIEAYTFHRFSLFEAIEKTARLRLPYMGGLSFQKVSARIPKNLEPGLTDDELREIRLKLDDEGVRMLTYYIQDIPGDEAGCRRVFEFGRMLGIETFMTEPAPAALDTIEKFADAYGINVALHNHDRKASPHYWNPDGILAACKGRSPRLGAAADVGYWLRAGIDPVAGVRALKDRLITIQIHDLNTPGPEGRDVPWGTGAGKTADLLRELRRLKLQPTLFGLEYSHNFMNNTAEAAQCVEFFNKTSLEGG